MELLSRKTKEENNKRMFFVGVKGKTTCHKLVQLD